MVRKIKKILLSISGFIILLSTKVAASVSTETIQPAYGIPSETLNSKPEFIVRIIKFLGIILIPIIIIIGIVVYVKNRKNNKEKENENIKM